jgi:hypothetical protein
MRFKKFMFDESGNITLDQNFALFVVRADNISDAKRRRDEFFSKFRTQEDSMMENVLNPHHISMQFKDGKEFKEWCRTGTVDDLQQMLQIWNKTNLYLHCEAILSVINEKSYAQELDLYREMRNLEHECIAKILQTWNEPDSPKFLNKVTPIDIEGEVWRIPVRFGWVNYCFRRKGKRMIVTKSYSYDDGGSPTTYIGTIYLNKLKFK